MGITGPHRRLKPDLIFHYTIKANVYGTLAASRARLPSVSVITGLGYTFSGNGWLQSIVRRLYKIVLHRNEQIWFLNEDDRSFFTDHHLVDPAKTFLLPGEGVDTKKFFPAPCQSGKKDLTFLLIGRLIRHKGIIEFVEAARILKTRGLRVNCQILGFFDEKNPVAIAPSMLKEWTDQQLITYLGHTDNVVPFIEKADCIVLPSYREGLPISLLEGASMCKALIASDTPGCRAIIIPDRNGLLCQPGSAADLAEKMQAYCRLDDNARLRMGLEGREIVLARYTQEIVADIYRQKIRRLLHPETRTAISSHQPSPQQP